MTMQVGDANATGRWDEWTGTERENLRPVWKGDAGSLRRQRNLLSLSENQPVEGRHVIHTDRLATALRGGKRGGGGKVGPEGKCYR